jgi:hypothetical protein
MVEHGHGITMAKAESGDDVDSTPSLARELY